MIRQILILLLFVASYIFYVSSLESIDKKQKLIREKSYIKEIAYNRLHEKDLRVK